MLKLLLLALLNATIFSYDVVVDKTQSTHLKNKRFNKHSKYIVIDNYTNLMWENKYVSESMSYCENLNLGGYKDWKLPSFGQAQSIFDYSLDIPRIHKKLITPDMNIRFSIYSHNKRYISFPTLDGTMMSSYYFNKHEPITYAMTMCVRTTNE